MGILFYDSFDHVSAANLSLKWDTVFSAVQIGTGAGRFGTNCLRFPNGGTFVRKALGAHPATVIIGMAYKKAIAGIHSIVSFLEGGFDQVDLRHDAAGLLYFTRDGTQIGGFSSYALPSSSYNYIEVKVFISNTVGTAEVRVNGDAKLSLTGQDTLAQNDSAVDLNAWIDTVHIAGNNSSVVDVDDLYILDTSGGAPLNNYLGDVRVSALFPNAAGDTTEWDVVGAGSNFQAVDETDPNDDTDYVKTAVLNEIDLYNYEPLPSSSGTVYSVAVRPYARKDDAGARSIRALAKSGATTGDNGSDLALPASYGYLVGYFNTNPDTAAAWTVSEINAAQFGVKLTV